MSPQIRTIFNQYLPWLPVVGLLMLISSIPYGWSVYQCICCYVLGIGYALWWCFSQQWREIHWKNTNWLYIVMLALWAMIPLRQLFDSTPPTDYFQHQWHGHEWFLYFGLAGLLGFPKRLRMKHVAYVMLATGLFMLLHSLYLYFGTSEAGTLLPFFRFDYLRRTAITSHMIMNLYINTALILGFWLLPSLSRWWQKTLLLLVMGAELLLIFFSDGRIGLLSSLLIFGVVIVYYIAQKSKLWAFACAIVLLAASGFTLLNQPKLTDIPLRQEPRLAIWDFAVRMAKERPVTGYGYSTLSNEYIERAYTDSVMYNGFIEPIINSYPDFAHQGRTMNTHHPHNAFLQYWLALGLGGVLLLCALFGIAACLPAGENRIYLWLFLLALFLQSMTEPIGGHLLPIFIAVMLFVWERTKGQIDLH